MSRDNKNLLDKKFVAVYFIETCVNSIWVQLCLLKGIQGTAPQFSIMLPSNLLNTPQ